MLSALLCLLVHAAEPNTATCEHPGDTADAAAHQVEHLLGRVENLEARVDQSIAKVDEALEVLKADSGTKARTSAPATAPVQAVKPAPAKDAPLVKAEAETTKAADPQGT